MTPEELEAQRLAEEAEAQRLAEEAEAQRLAQEAAATNPIMQPTDLIGQQGQQETVMDTNPLALAGLGGAAAFQGMFPFASEAAANSRGTTLPQLMGTSNSQFTGTNAGRLTPGTQILPQTQLVPSGQPPAVRVGGPPAVPGSQVVPSGSSQGKPIKMAQKVGQARLPGSADTLKPGMGSIQKLASGFLKGGLFGALATPNTTGDATISGAYERRVAAGEDPNQVRQSLGLASDYGAIQLLPESELAAPQMSRLSDEPLVFNAPTGPSSTATQAAQLAETLPDDAGLMGAPGVQGTGIPTTTLNVDGGSATVPQGLADLTFRTLNPIKEAEQGSPQAIFEGIRAKGPLSPELIAAGQARAEAMGTTFDPETGFSRDAYLAGQADPGPMGRDATMDRLGGRTLNEYLNAPNGTEGVSGLRTDPQGRMIPGGFDNRADAYGQYEDEVSQAYQRQSERMQQRADQRDGTAGPRTYGGYTTSQLRGMVGGGDNLRAAQMRAEAGLNPVTGNRESTEEQNQLQTEVLKARLTKLKEQDPDKLSKAESYADRLKLQGDARTAFIFSQMGTAMDDVFGLEGTGAGGGGGGEVPDSIAGLASQYANKIITGPDGRQYKSDGKSWTVVQ